jgi:hypothetical protein
VCLTRIGGVRRIGGAPCAADETRVCGRELITNADGLLVKDQLDNDCNGVTDDLVSTAAHFVLTGEFVRDGAEMTMTTMIDSVVTIDSSSSARINFASTSR